MKFGAMQNVLGSPLENVFDVAAQIGFDGVELDWSSPEEAITGSLAPANRPGIKAAAHAAGVAISSVVAGFLNGGNIAQATHEADAMRAIRTGIQLCENVGAGVLLVPFFGAAEIRDQDEERLISNLRALAREAERFHVTLGIETARPGHRMRRVFEAVDSPKVGAYWDMANCWSVGYDGLEDLRQLSGHIVQVHAKEWSGPHQERQPGQYPGLNQVPFGTGDVPVTDIIRLLKTEGYDGWVVLETGDFGDHQGSAANALDVLIKAAA